MARYAKIMATPIPQSHPLDSRQVKNSAGGYTYQLDCWARLQRFLVLGSDAATYYASAQKLTRENAKVIDECLAADAERTINEIVTVSEAGRAPKNDPAIFALALASAHPDVSVRQRALVAMPRVCRISTHLFQFLTTVHALGRGWGRTLKRAVGKWYDDRPVADLAYQTIKYRSRENWTHKGALWMSHPKGDSSPERTALYRWLSDRDYNVEHLPALVTAHLQAMRAEKAKELLPLIHDHRLPWEALPTWALNDVAVWQEMLPSMPLHALVRNLGKITSIDAIKPLSDQERLVVEKLADEKSIRKSRLHPFAILLAMTTYSMGHGVKGSLTWSPNARVLDALDGAFYKAFANVEPTGKRLLLALDVSGSMSAALIGSTLSCKSASAALALVTMATEQNVHVVGFTSGSGRFTRSDNRLTPLNISARQRLTDAVRAVSGLPFGGTDCALPMLYAAAQGLQVDAFVVYTDNETWAGSVHPMQALRDYRKATGINAKLIVVGMTATGFTIADPQDGGCMDVVGFDASIPSLINDFIRD